MPSRVIPDFHHPELHRFARFLVVGMMAVARGNPQTLMGYISQASATSSISSAPTKSMPICASFF